MDTMPRIKDQVPVTMIKNDLLLGEKRSPRFNGSICRFKDKVYFGYRYYGPNGKTTIGLSILNDKYQAVEHVPIDVPVHGTTGIIEDCRLFTHEGKLWMSFVEVDIVGRSCRAIQRLVQFGARFSAAQDHHLKYGRNYDKQEKNWMYFSTPDGLKFVYDLTTQEVVRMDKSTPINIGKEKPIFWGLGHLRGGSPLLPHTWNGQPCYLGTYHGGTDHEWLRRRYSLGFVAIDAKAPHKILGLSYPMVYGCEEEPYCGQGNPRCVFPSGIIDKGGLWDVSCGINDTTNYVLHFDKNKVDEAIVPIEWFQQDNGRCFLIHKDLKVRTQFGDEMASTLGYKVRHSGKTGSTYMVKTEDPFLLKSLEGQDGVVDIPIQQYEDMHQALMSRQLSYCKVPEYLKKKK